LIHFFKSFRLVITMSSPSSPPDAASSPQASITSLTVALLGMKERCTKQQRRISELEQENLLLNTSRNDLYTEIKKLHEANVKLREKNLAQGRELHQSNKENCDIRSRWEQDMETRNKEVRQLERLQQEVIKRSRTLSRDESREDTEEEDNTISSLRTEEVAGDCSMQDCTQDTATDIRLMAETGASRMAEIAARLTEQRDALKTAVVTLTQRKAVLDQAAENIIAASLAAIVQNGSNGDTHDRRCPMCEVVFPEKDTTQEQFESHVVDHFSYEESDTLSHFDTVPDAFWPEALRDQTLLQ